MHGVKVYIFTDEIYGLTTMKIDISWLLDYDVMWYCKVIINGS
jgi:hypothetical protein